MGTCRDSLGRSSSWVKGSCSFSPISASVSPLGRQEQPSQTQQVPLRLLGPILSPEGRVQAQMSCHSPACSVEFSPQLP